MKVIIIEDEKPAARRLQRLLQDLDIEITALLHSVEESIEYLINKEHPDLIFLDIQLNDGLSFEIFEQVKIHSAIIFTTAYDEYALQAFKLNSIDYLLKPIDEEELNNAVEQFKLRFRESVKPTNLIDFNDVVKMLSDKNTSYKKRFTVKVGEYLKLIRVEEVQLFYSENKGTYIHLENGRNYLIDETLEQLESILEPAVFYRISRNAIINMKAISDMVSHTNSRLKIKINSFNELDLIVSRERVKDFKAWLIA